VNNVLIDSLNYQGRVRGIFIKNNWDHALTEGYARETAGELIRLFGDRTARVQREAPPQ
jgi:hypothetical protein